MLDDTEPKDIYSAIVSSQFDADRLDYIQRDRLMTGVEFGHIDRRLVARLPEGRNGDGGAGTTRLKRPASILGPKGIQVAEEYLEARFRLYRMVYMHKTTRAAEKMLESGCCKGRWNRVRGGMFVGDTGPGATVFRCGRTRFSALISTSTMRRSGLR